MVYDRTKERRKRSAPQLARARALRHNQVSTEDLFWSFVRNRQFNGYKFRRQVRIDPFVVDFICLARSLIVEFDGPHHDRRKNEDRQRDLFLEAQGYQVFRFRNDELAGNTAMVMRTLEHALGPPSPRPSPPLKRGRG